MIDWVLCVSASGHSSVTDKKETSNSPSVSVTDKGKRQSLSPAMESPQAFISAQQSSKPPKISPKSGARKNQKSVEGVKHNETTVPDSNHRNHSSAQLDVTPASKHTSKAAKKAGGLPLASTHLKVPLVELKTVPKESPISPKKRYKSGSFSKCEEEFPTDVPMEDVAVSLVSSGGVLDMGNDVVHCVCRDVTDEGFMIQVSRSCSQYLGTVLGTYRIQEYVHGALCVDVYSLLVCVRVCTCYVHTYVNMNVHVCLISFTMNVHVVRMSAPPHTHYTSVKSACVGNTVTVFV